MKRRERVAPFCDLFSQYRIALFLLTILQFTFRHSAIAIHISVYVNCSQEQSYATLHVTYINLREGVIVWYPSFFRIYKHYDSKEMESVIETQFRTWLDEIQTNYCTQRRAQQCTTRNYYFYIDIQNIRLISV